MQYLKSATALAVLALTLTACGQKAATTPEADEAYLIADSAVSSVNGALNDSEQANSYAALKRPSFEFVSSAYASSCGVSRFSPSVGSNCNSTAGTKTVISNFNGCSAGRSDEFDLSGQVTLTFDSNSTCNTWLSGGGLPTSGSVTRTTSNFSRTNPNGSVVSMTSATHTNYLGSSIGGGVTTTFGSGTRSLAINGLHRVRTSVLGKTVYDHSVTTTSPVVVIGTRIGGNRVISSGAVRVDHNVAKFSSTVSMAGLSWNSSCCHPVAGSLTFTLSGSTSGSIVVDYATGTCGEANVTKDGSSLGTIDIPSCE